VSNAVEDALAARGIELTELPHTPEQIFATMTPASAHLHTLADGRQC
jgi:hypothetical protein